MMHKPFYIFKRLGPEILTCMYDVDTDLLTKYFVKRSEIIDFGFYESYPEALSIICDYDNDKFIEKAPKEVMERFRDDLLMLAEKYGEAGAYTLIASTYYDHGELLRYFKLAAENGSVIGMLGYGQFLCIKDEANEGLKWLKRSADKGNSEAMLYLAVSYQYGTLTERNNDIAADYYWRCIDNGDNYSACQNLAVMYVDANCLNTALELFQRAEKIKSENKDNDRLYEEYMTEHLDDNIKNCLSLLAMPYNVRRNHVMIDYHAPEFEPLLFIGGRIPDAVGASKTSLTPDPWQPTDTSRLSYLDMIERAKYADKVPRQTKKVKIAAEGFVFPVISFRISGKRVLNGQHELIFLENNVHLALNRYIQQNIGRLRDLFRQNDYRIIYMPYHKRTEDDIPDIVGSYVYDDFRDLLDLYSLEGQRYYYSEQNYWQLLMQNADFPPDCAGFLRFRPDLSDKDNYAAYDYIIFPHLPGTDWDKAFNEFLRYMITLPFSDTFKPTLPLKVKIVVSKDNRIVLIDDERTILEEINMTMLPKTLYILFLRHPEGIELKRLMDYRDELLDIYRSMSNRKNIEASIDTLIDPTNNSANEKISRIRQAFEGALEKYNNDIDVFVPIKKQHSRTYLVQMAQHNTIFLQKPLTYEEQPTP